MAKTTQKDMFAMLSELETTLNEYFGKKAPQLPKDIKDFIVMASPYLVILGIVMSVPAIFALLGLSVLFAPMMAFGGGWTLMSILSLVTLIASMILEISAVSGLFAKKKSAWDKLFWVSLIGIISSLAGGNLVGLVIGTAISWYVLFQVRSYYK
jgi:hypothetical protein